MSAFDPKRTSVGDIPCHLPALYVTLSGPLNVFRRSQIPDVINHCWRIPEPRGRQCDAAIFSKALLEVRR